MQKRKQRIVTLCILIVIQVVVSVFAWHTQDRGAAIGFLVQSEGKYIVAWKHPHLPIEYRDFDALDQALTFASEELQLVVGNDPDSNLELEHLWMDERFGAYTVFWKMIQPPFLHRITFHRQDDALFFAGAVRSGHYTPSPFGHSILLLPKTK